MAYTPTEELIEDAIEEEVRDWKYMSISDTLREWDALTLKDPQIVKAATAVGFAKDAVGLMGSLGMRANVSLFLLTYASQAYDAYHEKEMKRKNALLKTKAEEHINKFIENIRHTAVAFTSKDEFKEMKRRLAQFFSKKEFEDDDDAEAFVKGFLIYHEMISSGRGKVVEQLKKTIRLQLTEIRDIFAASQYNSGWGQAEMRFGMPGSKIHPPKMKLLGEKDPVARYNFRPRELWTHVGGRHGFNKTDKALVDMMLKAPWLVKTTRRNEYIVTGPGYHEHKHDVVRVQFTPFNTPMRPKSPAASAQLKEKLTGAALQKTFDKTRSSPYYSHIKVTDNSDVVTGYYNYYDN